MQPIDGVSANVSVNAKIEGRTDGPTGAGVDYPAEHRQNAEQESLSALIEAVDRIGSPPRP